MTQGVPAEVLEELQSLRARVAELEALLRIVPMGLAIATNADASAIESNAYMADTLGVSLDTNISLTAPPDEQPPFKLRLNGEDIPPNDLPLKQVAASGVPLQDVDLEVLRPDGQVRYIKGNVAPVYGDGSTVRGSVGAFWDVTERKQAEEALALSEKRFRLLSENAYDAVLVMDRTGVITYANPSTDRVCGYTPEELLGRSAFEFVHLLDVQAAQDKLLEVLQGPRTHVRVELRVLHKDGSILWIEISAVNLLHEPSVQGVVLNFHEVTERRNAEEQLQAREERFRSLIEQSYDAVVLVDVHGTFLYVSPSYTAIHGYEADEVVGTNGFALVHPDDLNATRATFAQCLERPRETLRAEFRARHKDGHWLWLEVSGTNLLDVPSVGGVVVNLRDITERKQAEQDILELSNPLLPIADRVLLVPVVGVLNEQRIAHFEDRVLTGIRSHRARTVILDLTGAAKLDMSIANRLVEVIQASSLLGARVLLTGISAQFAGTLTTLGVRAERFETVGDLQRGIEIATRTLASPGPVGEVQLVSSS